MPRPKPSNRRPAPAKNVLGSQRGNFDSDDEFATKTVVGFDPASSSDEDDDQEESVFDIGVAASDSDDEEDDDVDDDEDDSDDDKPVAKPTTTKQKQHHKLVSGGSKGGKGAALESDDESEEEEADSDDDSVLGGGDGDVPKFGWGNRRSAFYNADLSTHHLDERDALDEESEAIRLQKKLAGTMAEEDFAVGTRQGKGEGQQVLSTPGTSVERIQRNTENMTKQEKLQLIAAESPELLTLLQDMKEKVEELRERVIPVLQRVKAGQIPTDHGVTFLEVKHQTLLSYVTNIVFYLLLKAEGKSVKDHPVMDQLHHIRTILERIKPVDAKLKNQITRLVKAATAVKDGEDGSHKPRPQALVSHSADRKPTRGGDEDGSGSDEDEGADKAGGVYKPLKRSAALFDESKRSKAEREEERRKARIAKSKLFKDLLEQYTENPEEVRAGGDREAVDDSLAKTEEERRRFEEENFVRLTVPREEKSLRKKRERERQRVDPLKDLTTGFAEIERFGSGRGFGGGDEDEDDDDDDGGRGSEFYKSAQAALQRKKKSKADAQDARAQAAAKKAQSAYVEEDVEGERRVSKDIMKNRGLTKYRNKERKNPRKNQRIKYESALKRRSGQVQAVRTGEAGRYSGEATGIRTTVSRSHKIA